MASSGFIVTKQVVITASRVFAQLNGYTQIVCNPTAANINVNIQNTVNGAEVMIINKSSTRTASVRYTPTGGSLTTVILSQYESFHLVTDTLGNFYPQNPIISLQP